jgi:hypothetical protein
LWSNRPGGRLFKPQDHLGGGGFPAAAFARQGEDLGRLDIKTDMVRGGQGVLAIRLPWEYLLFRLSTSSSFSMFSFSDQPAGDFMVVIQAA